MMAMRIIFRSFPAGRFKRSFVQFTVTMEALSINQFSMRTGFPSPHELLKAQIAHFFEHYKDLEKGKWVKVEGWENAEAAKAEIVASFERAKNK